MQPGDNMLAVLAAFAGMLAGFFAIAKIMLSQASKDRDADRQERERLSNGIRDMANSSRKVAVATERAADEAKQRNGHLADLVIQQGENFKAIAESATETIISAVQNVNQQNVEHMHVQREVIEHVNEGKSNGTSISA